MGIENKAFFFFGLSFGLAICLIIYAISIKPVSPLESFVIELNQDIEKWWVYNLTNMGKELNESMLRLEGGVCNHYSDLWVNSSIEAGYFAKELNFKTRKYIMNNKTYFVAHSIVVISDDTGFCIVDENRHHCFGFKNYSESKEEFIKGVLIEKRENIVKKIK